MADGGLMADGGPARGAIPWHASTAAQLPTSLRRRIADNWAYRRFNECGAARAFGRLVEQWQAAEAPAELVEQAREALADEQAHVALCTRLCQLYGDEPVPQPPTGTELPAFSDHDVRTRALLGAVLMGCIAESVGCVHLDALMQRAADPAMRAVHALLLGHDVKHSRLGWAYLAFEARRDSARVQTLVDELPMLIDTFGANLSGGEGVAPTTDDLAAAGHGVLLPGEARRLYAETLDNLILPGFAEFGIDSAWLRPKLRWRSLGRQPLPRKLYRG